MTDTIKYRSGKRLAAAASMLALAYALPAVAQTVVYPADIIPPQVPLSDADCDFNQTFQPREEPFCTVDGTRTVTYIGRQREVRNQTQDRLIDSYRVLFSGNLKVDGAPVATGANPVWPYGGPGNGPYDISNFLGTDGQMVNVDLDYVAERFQTVATGGNGAAPANNPAGFFSRFSSFNGTINSIDIDKSDYVVTQSGDGYNFVLKSIDPSNVVNNSTALSGYFRSDDDNRAIQFGKLTGSASVAGGPNIVTPFPAETGASNTGLLSLYSLTYNVTAQVTTTLDENGLVTPQVTVTDGIAMNDSRVTGLAAGVNAADAVNLGQLNAVGTVADTALSDAAAAQTSANTALANAATAQTTADTAQSDAANALARADDAHTRIDALEANSGAVTSGGGTGSTATGTGSLAGGQNSTADGAGAIALGLGNSATGDGAVAIGDPNVATGTGAVAIGADNTATGTGAVALGNLSVANGDGAVALGNGANAGTAGSVALGGNASVTAANSVALGAGSVADQANTVSVGAAGSERRVTNLAAGVAATDAANVGQVAAEGTARAAADNTLQGNIDAEVAARAAADTALNTAVAAEVVARQGADTAIVASIANEVTTRQQADLQLSQRIDTYESQTAAFTANLAAEQAARIAADNATSARLASMDGRIGDLEARMDGFDDRVASATAVATAMGGNAFLPDMRFNLTANVATYDGAHAGAFQIGAMVTSNVAVNAGVATGFNRGGKTAARAGVTVGF